MQKVVFKKGAETREKILDAAEAMILERGFSGVSVDQLIKELGMTKGAFFHHFKSKNDMAARLIRRYANHDAEYFENALARSKKLSSDPLQQLLITIGLYEEDFAELKEVFPGCLMASYVYEAQLFDRETRQVVSEAFLRWRNDVTRMLEVISERYPPRQEVHLPSLADEFLVIIEGAFILSKSLEDTKIVPDQLRHYKNYLELIFNQD